jgi:uncharacterized Zn finger protein (UPF0148 family)
MTDLKCLACKTRLYHARRGDMVCDMCRARANAADGGAAGTHQRIADRFGDVAARRSAFLAQAQLNARRWVEDDGHFRAERAAVARPEARSPLEMQP